MTAASQRWPQVRPAAKASYDAAARRRRAEAERKLQDEEDYLASALRIEKLRRPMEASISTPVLRMSRCRYTASETRELDRLWASSILHPAELDQLRRTEQEMPPAHGGDIVADIAPYLTMDGDIDRDYTDIELRVARSMCRNRLAFEETVLVVHGPNGRSRACFAFVLAMQASNTFR